MSQERYAEAILKRFNMSNCKPTQTPAHKSIHLTKATDDDELDNNFPYRQVIGSLIYLMTGTRPDFSWIVSKLLQFLDHNWKSHKKPVVALSFSGNDRNYKGSSISTAATCSSQHGTGSALRVDNLSAIALATNTAKPHRRSKHIDIRYHLIRLQTEIVYTYIETKSNLAEYLLSLSITLLIHNRLVTCSSLKGRIEIQANKTQY